MTDELRELLSQRQDLTSKINYAQTSSKEALVISQKSLDDVIKVALVPDQWEEKAEQFEKALDDLGDEVDKFWTEITEAMHFSMEDKKLETLKKAIIDFYGWYEEGKENNLAEHQRLERKCNRQIDLIKAQEDYISFLGEQISNKATFLEVHHQGATTLEVEKGTEHRNKIASIIESLERGENIFKEKE